jgi:hypothetical protein
MTLPVERTRAVNDMAREIVKLSPFLHGKSETVRVPRQLLRDLHARLRHYPTELDMKITAEKVPELWKVVDE